MSIKHGTLDMLNEQSTEQGWYTMLLLFVLK